MQVKDASVIDVLPMRHEEDPEGKNGGLHADDGTTGKYTGRDAPFIGTASELLGEFESSQGTPKDFVSR
jgi:hypothetical protein